MGVGAPESCQGINLVAELGIERAADKAVRRQLQRRHQLSVGDLRRVFVAGARLPEFSGAPVIPQPSGVGRMIGAEGQQPGGCVGVLRW